MFLARQFRNSYLALNGVFQPHSCLSLTCPNGHRSSDNYNSRKQDPKPEEGVLDIPIDRLKISYCRSSGPGGQHVNKVNSKAEVRFHVNTADWLPVEVRKKLLVQCKSRVNKAGELVVTAETSRSQHRNLGECVEKLRHMIAEASYSPPEPSEEDLALRASRLEKRNQERLKQKKLLSALKQSRRMNFD